MPAFRTVLFHTPFIPGRLAQLVRAPALQAGGHRFESCTAHHINAAARNGCGFFFILLEPHFPKRGIFSASTTISYPQLGKIHAKIHQRTTLSFSNSCFVLALILFIIYIIYSICSVPRIRTNYGIRKFAYFAMTKQYF